jgi:recombination protein RecA
LRPDVQATINKLNRDFGQYTTIKASDLDVALGGGWPGGKWVEIRGRESSGKTAVTLKTVAANQKLDPEFETLWLAAETYDVDQAAALGVDNSRVTVIPTQEMELAFELLIEAASSKAFDLQVLDSYPALIPGEESEKAMDEFTTAVGARLMNKFTRKAGKATERAPDGSERPMLGIIINQYRDKIGGFARFGVPQTTPGGHGKDYFFYTILEVARDEFITEKRPGIPDPVKVGQSIKFRTIKNKSAAPQQTASVDFYFRGAPYLGFSRGTYDVAKEYFTMGVLFGVIRKGGTWFSYEGYKWQGKDKVLAAIREDLELQEAIKVEVLDRAKNPKLVDQISEAQVEDAESNGTRVGMSALDG